jgi:hypothetical protein
MNGMRTAKQAGRAETISTERGQWEGAAVIAEPSGKQARGGAEVTVCTKSAEPANKDAAQGNAAGRTSRRVAANRKPVESSEGRDRKGADDVKSVAEFAVVICEDPDSRKKRLKLAEALRERGLNESKLAAMFSGVAEKLSHSEETGAVGVAAAKLLFDVLKELAEWLEPEKAAGKSAASEAPPFVRLIHNVPRPVRTE